MLPFYCSKLIIIIHELEHEFLRELEYGKIEELQSESEVWLIDSTVLVTDVNVFIYTSGIIEECHNANF